MESARDNKPSNSLALWEQRTVNRVLQGGHDHILDRSRRIVETTYELLKSLKLDELTIQMILKNSGLSRRAFYERFTGKDDLMLAVFEEAIRRAAKLYASQVHDISDPCEKLRLIITSILLGQQIAPDEGLGSDRRAAAMSREHMRLAESNPQELQTALGPLLTLLKGILIQAIEAGAVRRSDPEKIARFLYNLVSTTAHTELLRTNTEESHPGRRLELANEVWDFCYHAIRST